MDNQLDTCSLFKHLEMDHVPRVDVLEPGENLGVELNVVGGEIRGLVVDVLHQALQGGQTAAKSLEKQT